MLSVNCFSQIKVKFLFTMAEGAFESSEVNGATTNSPDLSRVPRTVCPALGRRGFPVEPGTDRVDSTQCFTFVQCTGCAQTAVRHVLVVSTYPRVWLARTCRHNIDNSSRCVSLKQQAVWPPGSADTVCPRPRLTSTFDRLTLKLVCESHLRWATFFRIWAR